MRAPFNVPSPAPTRSKSQDLLFCFCGDRDGTPPLWWFVVSWDLNGFPTARKYSRCASLDTLASSTPYFLRARHKKQLSTVFSSLTRLPHQKSRIILIRLFYPNRRFGIFAIRRADTTNDAIYRKRYASRFSVYLISPCGAGYHHGIAVHTFPAV